MKNDTTTPIFAEVVFKQILTEVRRQRTINKQSWDIWNCNNVGKCKYSIYILMYCKSVCVNVYLLYVGAFC